LNGWASICEFGCLLPCRRRGALLQGGHVFAEMSSGTLVLSAMLTQLDLWWPIYEQTRGRLEFVALTTFYDKFQPYLHRLDSYGLVSVTCVQVPARERGDPDGLANFPLAIMNPKQMSDSGLFSVQSELARQFKRLHSVKFGRGQWTNVCLINVGSTGDGPARHEWNG
jgi:hypothetical protein